MTRKPRKPTDHLVTARLLTHAYGQMGEIATAGGFFTYFVVMEIYGFESSTVFNLLSIPAVNPVNSNGKVDLSINDWYKFEVASTAAGPFNNPYLPPASKAVLNTEFPNWLSPLNNALDVRGFYLSTSASECAGKQIIDGYCQHFTNWPTTYLHTVSPITKQEVAFTPETIFYAQSAYFVTIVMVQWSNVFACKSRKVNFYLFRSLLPSQDSINICLVDFCLRHAYLFSFFTLLELTKSLVAGNFFFIKTSTLLYFGYSRPHLLDDFTHLVRNP